MFGFCITCSILAFIIYAGFVCMSIRLFGMQKSYSSFAPYWGSAFPIHNVNLWSAATVVTALLLIPAYIQVGEGTGFQFLGFLVPLYLCIVAFTPEYQTNKTQGIVHIIFTCLCAAGFLFYTVAILHVWKLLIFTTALMLYNALASKTLKSCLVFWLEEILLLAAIILPLLKL